MKGVIGIAFGCWLLWTGGLVMAQRDAIISFANQHACTCPLTMLNSEYTEQNISITPDGQTLYFSTSRGGQSWTQEYITSSGRKVFDRDIWVSKKVDGKWEPPTCLKYGINTSLGEDEPWISADQQTLYYQNWNYHWETTGGPYYKIKQRKGIWQNPKGLGGGIKKFAKSVRNTFGIALSPDQRMFYISAQTSPENPDIYWSKKSVFGWKNCQKHPLSTRGKELGVFISNDGKTLYFASDGYTGFGGLDIYKAQLGPKGQWGPVINLGPGINTPEDESGFVVSENGEDAFLIRNGDIYFVDLSHSVIPP